MTDIYINDLLADFEDEETITGSYAGTHFGNLAKRKGIKGNTHTLPFSQQNKLIYDGAEVQGSNSEKPYRKATYRAEIDGVIVFEGWAVLDEAKEGYEVQAFAGASDFYNTISNKKLSDLDLSAYAHIWNETSIVNSWANTTGYIYAFVEYGKEIPFSLVPPEYILPQMFFHSLINQIVTDAGYTLHGDVLTNPDYLKQLVLANQFPLSIAYGGTWDLTTLLDPNLTQSKMWLDFANMYGLQFDINELNGEIYASYIDNVLFNDPQEWTEKIDNSEKPRKRYRFTEWGQTTNLRYNFDDICTQDFKKAVAIDDENLQLEADLYKSSFYLIQDADPVLNPDGRAIARTFVTKPGKGFSGIWRDDLTYQENDNNSVYYNGTYYKPVADSLNQPPPNDTYWEVVQEKDIWDIKSRPMYGMLTTDVTSTIEINFPTPVLVTRVVNNFGMSWEDLYPLYYRVFNRIKDRTKRLQPLVILNYSDVNQMDFTKAKRIDNELYIVEEVLQFKLNRKESTLVDLVRI
jgi:hypothetical protein